MLFRSGGDQRPHLRDDCHPVLQPLVTLEEANGARVVREVGRGQLDVAGAASRPRSASTAMPRPDRSGGAADASSATGWPSSRPRRSTCSRHRRAGAYLALPDGRGLDLYKQPLDELARHRNMMRSRGWTLPAITPEHLVDELTPAIEAAEQRATAAYPRHSHPRTITPKENDR